jgi:metal-responsive CopG/Arc/MetJ family transcriptional regulator
MRVLERWRAEMIQVSLSEHIIGKLRQMAERKGTDISELLDRAIERYLADEPSIPDQGWGVERDGQIAQIEREQQAFETQHKRLLEKYGGQYIAMRHSKVVDHDEDSSALWQRVHKRFGRQPILITPVLHETRQTMVVRGPRLLENIG